MSVLDELRLGKREGCFYKKTGILGCSNLEEEMKNMPKKIYVYEWDKVNKIYIGYLVSAKDYYGNK